MTRDATPAAAVLAVDGGNSKTDLALVAADGALLAAARGPGSSHQRLGLPGAVRALRTGLTALRRRAGIGPRQLLAEVGVFCLAGVDLPVDDRQVGAALRAERLCRNLVLHNDTRALLWAGSRDRWGIAVGAGTGLNCVGVASDGREVRFPALGLISGDWIAGGRWLGVRALGQAVRAVDGRGPRTALVRAVPAFYGLPDPMAVAEAVYTGRIEERQLRELAPTVFHTAAEGDPVARSLLDDLAQEAVTYVRAAATRLALTDVSVPVVLGGGLFRTGYAPFVQRVRAGIRAVTPGAELRLVAGPPVVGAARLGLAELGAGPAAGDLLAAALTHASLTGAPEPTAGADGSRPAPGHRIPLATGEAGL